MAELLIYGPGNRIIIKLLLRRTLQLMVILFGIQANAIWSDWPGQTISSKNYQF
ncbi:MAG: hypothetical protein ABI861_00245 [Panacibacter sp.]